MLSRRNFFAAVLGLAAAACTPPRPRSRRKRTIRAHHPSRTPRKKAAPVRGHGSHPGHEHDHGSHPHSGGDHHHHPHPHPHMTGPGGHHHPY